MNDDELIEGLEEGSEDYLEHYGMPRRSGRYPWGSGEDPYQRTDDFASRVDRMKQAGMTESEIAKELEIYTYDSKGNPRPSSTKLRAQYSICLEDRQNLVFARMNALKKDGLNRSKIAEAMGVNESTVRGWEKQQEEGRATQARNTANFLKAQVDKKGPIDVGRNVSKILGVSEEKMNVALYMLEEEGYVVRRGSVPQATQKNQKTNLKILCPPGAPKNAAYRYEDIKSIDDSISYDDGQTFHKAFQYPTSLDMKRLKIVYAEDGGSEKDGVIELRRNVKDISLGDSNYAQVRVMVDNKYYLKGMAVYADDLPDGIDVRFNSSKSKNKPLDEVLKPLKTLPNGQIDKDNPFGALIKERGGQSMYVGEDGKEHLSLINKRAEQGDWSEWKDKVPAQFLSKQSKTLIKNQLDLSIADAKAEYEDIAKLENPVVKRKLLEQFANQCDKTAVHLEAAALPRQKYHVLLPVNSLSDDEVFAPNYKDGEKLALVRYPHGGTFEIPILTVNNKNPEAKRVIGITSEDAVGINKRVAERLSGADFDGDTVMVIPTIVKGDNTKQVPGKVMITSTRPLAGLIGFDTKMAYPERPGMKYMKYKVKRNGVNEVIDNTQKEMGVITNLITDMTIKGATESELARAVRHSMVIVDAGKHKLDYKRSEIDNGIDELKKKYQLNVDPVTGKVKAGVSTLISRAKSQTSVPKTQGSPHIDPETGKLVYKQADDLYYTVRKVNKKTGEIKEIVKQRTQPSTKMAVADDAMELVSEFRAPQELLYANYANNMKALANKSRLEILATEDIPYSREAKLKYADEVKEIEDQLLKVQQNAPKERMAQIKANAAIQKKINISMEDEDGEYNEDSAPSSGKLSAAEIKKISQQELVKARAQVGAHRVTISITDKDWEAIQAGAFSTSKLKEIVNAVDPDRLRELATPREAKELSPAKIAKIQRMLDNDYSIEQIARSVGKSTSTIHKYIKDRKG